MIFYLVFLNVQTPIAVENDQKLVKKGPVQIINQSNFSNGRRVFSFS